MPKGPQVTFQIIPDGAAPSFSIRLPIWLIKTLFLFFSLVLFFLLFVFFSLSKLNTKALLADHYFHKNQVLLNDQKRLDSIQIQLLRISEKSKRIEDILHAHYPKNANKPSLISSNNLNQLIITKDQLRYFARQVDAIQAQKVSPPDPQPSNHPQLWPTRGLILRSYDSEHRAIDIAGLANRLIFASAQGVVKEAKWNRELGFYIEIAHQGRFTSIYGHLNRMYVDIGDFVEAGSAIGSMGTSGQAKSPQLHFAIFKDQIPLDPLTLLRH